MHNHFAVEALQKKALSHAASLLMSDSATWVICSEQQGPQAEASEPSSSEQTAGEEQDAGQAAQTAAHAAAEAPAAAGQTEPSAAPHENAAEPGQPDQVQPCH